MQRKQQVGKCWDVLYSLHVCVGAHQIRQLRLKISLVAGIMSCALGAS
jgi:hypothetical protein